MALQDLLPDATVLLALPPEELAFYILQAAKQSADGNGLMNLQTLQAQVTGGLHGHGPSYPPASRAHVEIALAEGWQWLETQLLIVRAPGINGTNGFRVLGRRAVGLQTEDQFKAFRQGTAFPKELLHPAIAERAWIAVMRGEFEQAVFFSFKAVEVVVREAGGFGDTDVGPVLMRRAFDPTNGPLTKLSDPLAERESLAHLFAGAIGSYKNPHSHRNVTITEAAEAQEMVMLASHLLRIVDSRRRP